MGAIINKLPPITTTQSVEFAKAIVKAHRNPFAHTTTVRVAAAYVPMESFIAYVVIKEIQTHGECSRIKEYSSLILRSMRRRRMICGMH